MARSPKDTEEEKPTAIQKQRAWQWQHQRKGKRQVKGRRIPRTVINSALAVFVIGLAILGCDLTRDDSESTRCSSTEASRGCDQWTTCSPQKSWTRGQSGGGILLGQMFGDWATSHQTSITTLGSFRENSCQVEGRVGAACGGMAKVPEESGRRISIPQAEIPGEAEATSRGFGQSRGGIHGGTRCSSRSCHTGRHPTGRNSIDPTQDSREYRDAAVGRDSEQAKAECYRGGRCRSGDEEAEIPHPHHRLASRQGRHGEDGFLIGRQDSCLNNDLARRPRFFCLAEFLEVDADAPPSQVGITGADWQNLRPPCMAQTIREGSSYPISSGTYGPRQAEYIAQLMRLDVETDSCQEAFDHCLWDETMNDLWHLDQIEASYWAALAQGLSPPSDVVRQIEGSTLWPLLTMALESGHPGGIDWNGAPFQGGPLSSLSERDLSLFVESMDSDCTYAYEVLAHNLPDFPRELSFHSHGYFERDQGVRTLQIPTERLHQWQSLVKEQWSDFEPSDSITLHVVVPQPTNVGFEIHVIARASHNPNEHRFILVDKVEESPQVELNRRVIATSRDPNGYEILLASEININVVTSHTILKHGNVIWQHHRHPQVQDGQYWRILVEDDLDESNLLQQVAITSSMKSPVLSPEGLHLRHPHVSDRWCDGDSAFSKDDISESNSLMQLPSFGIPRRLLLVVVGLEFEIPAYAWGRFCETCFASPEEGPWTLMTYGLLGSHIGFRPVVIEDMNPSVVKETLRAAWDDIQPRFTLSIPC